MTGTSADGADPWEFRSGPRRSRRSRYEKTPAARTGRLAVDRFRNAGECLPSPVLTFSGFNVSRAAEERSQTFGIKASENEQENQVAHRSKLRAGGEAARGAGSGLFRLNWSNYGPTSSAIASISRQTASNSDPRGVTLKAHTCRPAGVSLSSCRRSRSVR